MTANYEEQRIKALQQLDLLDTEAEAEFNDIVELASRLCHTPISLITLIDNDRQWLKAAKGTTLRETKRSISFCSHALLQNDLFVVPDAAADERFKDNELVTQDPHIRFYAGSLIFSPDNQKLGTLCIIDTKPRELRWQEADTLEKLSHQVTKLIELRYLKMQHARLLRKEEETERQAVLQKQHYKRLVHLSQTQAESIKGFFNKGMEALTSGRFTKKEISTIVANSELHQQQLAVFSEGLHLSAQLNDTLSADAKPVDVNDLFVEIEAEIKPLLASSLNRLQPIVNPDFSYKGKAKPLRFIITTVLELLLSSLKKTEIQLYLLERDGGIEIRVLLPVVDLTSTLSQYATEELQVDAASLNGQPFHVELALLRDLVHTMGGTKQVRRIATGGTAIELFIPPMAE